MTDETPANVRRWYEGLTLPLVLSALLLVGAVIYLGSKPNKSVEVRIGY